MPKIFLTKHSIERIEQRTKNKYFISNEILKTIYSKGLKVKNIRGKLKDYIQQYTDPKSIIRIYDEKIYIFTGIEGDIVYLKTVLNLPKMFKNNRKDIYIVKKRSN